MFKGLKPVVKFKPVHIRQTIVKKQEMWHNSRQCIECVASVDVVNGFMVGLLLNNLQQVLSNLLIIFDDKYQFGRQVRGPFEPKGLIEHFTKIISSYCNQQEIIIVIHYTQVKIKMMILTHSCATGKS